METKKIIAKIYLVAVILVMPFYYQNKYFDMTYAKARFLWIVGTILLLAYSLFWAKEELKIKFTVCQNQKTCGKYVRRLSLMDLSILLFCVSTWSSLGVSYHRKAAFWGNKGWFMGSLTITILTAMYFVVKKYGSIDRGLVTVSAVSVGIMGIWGIAHSFHIDVGNFHEEMENDFYDYIMTIGNVNWYAGLLSMIFPIICMLYLTQEEKRKRCMAIIYVDIMCYQLITCRSNGVMLGLISGGFILLEYLVSFPERLWRFLTLVCHISVMMGMVWGISHFYHGVFVQADSICFFLLEKKIWLIAGMVSGVLLLSHKKSIKKKNRSFRGTKGALRRLEKYRWEIFWIVILVVIAFLLLYETFRFSDSWGTSRGKVWIYVGKLWKKFKWKYKLFGCGCDCFGIVFMDTYGDYFNKTYLNAHNEFLQYLVTTGIVGVFSYSMIWVSSLLDFIKRRKKTCRDWILFSGIFGYLGQALVNNPQALNYAVLFILLSFYAQQE